MEESRAAAVIRSKLRVPVLPDEFVPRPRLRRLFAQLIERRRIVVVSATAGSGKTSAVVSALELVERTVLWLAVDRTDDAPGRLVTYLEAAIAPAFPQADGIATGALAAGIPHAESAGLLAESVGEAPAVLVLDDLERLGDEVGAWAVIEAIIRYTPATMSIVLISRRDIPTHVCGLPPGTAVAALGEAELAFTDAEAGEALAAVGKTDADAAAAVQATGGWVTGVLFEAWRSAEHVFGGGGESDPLNGYLSSQIIAELGPADREFLIATSLLDEVSVRRAATLGLDRAGERLAALRAAHLPVSWDADGRAMRCHSRFREFLQQRFDRLPTNDARSLRLAHARLLASDGLHEDAVAEFLRADSPEEALANAERSIVAVIERGDFALAETWLAALGDASPLGASPLTVAELMLAVARDDFRRVVRLADQLAALGERDRLAAASDTAVWTMIWGYIVRVRVDDVRAVLAAARPGAATELAKYAARVLIDVEGDTSERPALTGTQVDAFAYIADYALGNLRAFAQEPGSPWAEAVQGQWRIAALRALGRTDDALKLYERADSAGLVSLQTWIGAEVLIDAGRTEDARSLIERGRVLARETGHTAGEALNTLAAARLALRVDRDPQAATAALERAEHQLVARSFRFIGEMTEMWTGLARLMEHRDADALVALRRAVGGMVAGGRRLELPAAAVYLAEAEWRAGNEDEADSAADLGLATASMQGSNHVLLQALSDLPAVASRRIDVESHADSTWHDVGRALLAQGVPLATAVRSSVYVREFGTRALVVDGEEVPVRLTKTHELLAFLATRRPMEASRTELLDALFAGRTDRSARAYLRQATHWLRQLLADEAVVVEDGRLRISDDRAVASESTRFEAALAEAARLQGEERLAATLESLTIFDQGEYLPGSRSEWAEVRRRELGDLATDARYEAAELALAHGEYNQTRALVARVLEAEPFREPAWRLAMRAADTLGDQHGIMRAYQECERALAQVGTSPSPSTRQLLERLRR
jgi:DNA-binding SARP family transcriptional activator